MSYIQSLSESFLTIWSDDIAMKTLIEGKTLWGDIPGLTSSRHETHIHTTIKHDVPPFTPGIKTLIIRNLPRDITLHTVRNIFDKYGPIRDIYIPKNMDSTSPYYGTIKGFALIKFVNHLHSAAAYNSEYAKLIISNKHISIEFAKNDK